MVLWVPDQRFTKSARLCGLGNKDYFSWRPLFQCLAQRKTGSVEQKDWGVWLLMAEAGVVVNST